MSRYITPPNFDHHAEGIEGAPVDPWPADKRLQDDRVNRCTLDVLDTRPTVDDTLNPPSRPIRAVPVALIGERVLPVVRDTSTGKVAAVLGFGIVCFILGSLAGWAVAAMVVAS